MSRAVFGTSLDLINRRLERLVGQYCRMLRAILGAKQHLPKGLSGRWCACRSKIPLRYSSTLVFPPGADCHPQAWLEDQYVVVWISWDHCSARCRRSRHLRELQGRQQQVWPRALGFEYNFPFQAPLSNYLLLVSTSSPNSQAWRLGCFINCQGILRQET